MSRKIAP